MKNENKPKRLGAIERIQMASHVIQHLATQIHTVKTIEDKGLTFTGMPQDDPQFKEDYLLEVAGKMEKIMDQLMDFSVEQEVLNPIDWTIVQPALEILLKGKDRVDGKEDPPQGKVFTQPTQKGQEGKIPWE